MILAYIGLYFVIAFILSIAFTKFSYDNSKRTDYEDFFYWDDDVVLMSILAAIFWPIGLLIIGVVKLWLYLFKSVTHEAEKKGDNKG